MKRLFALAMIAGLCQMAWAQDAMEKTMEKRAREMHRVIGLNSKDEWKKFIQENYTKALIDKPMQAKVSTSDSDAPNSSSETKSAGNIEAKASMFERLHDDFGGSKIASIKATGDKLEMVLDNGDMAGTFVLKFSKEKPYLIDGMGIQVGEGRR